MDTAMTAAVRRRASLEDLTRTSLTGGMKTLAADAVSTVMEGLTSPAEALRVGGASV